tara:strand:+ start:221 stop:1528 length:1308 start_codon:yes stop_codon:yes gene_type:complete
MIKYPKKLDLAKYKKTINNPENKFGLPREVKFCKKCVVSNQRPNSTIEFANKPSETKKTIHFDEEGICDACNFIKKKESINWQERELELQELCNKYRKNNGEYDCVIPGSGGKDSIFASHLLKNKYKMNPITVTWSPTIYTDWGWRNFSKWINTTADNILMTPCGKTHRLLTRLSLEKLLHPFQPFILGQKTLAAKMAKKFNIKLIIYGENEAEYGNPKVQNNDSKVSAALYESHLDIENFVLGGVKVKELIENYGVKLSELQSYLPLEKGDPNKISNLDFRYLGYYLKWHPQSCYYYSVDNCDFEAAPERTVGTYSKYNSIDDKVDDLHYYTTYIKFGIGRATYDAAQEIRSKDIEREEGVSLVKKFDGEYPERFQKEIFEYLSLNKRDFSEAYSMFEQPKFDRKYFDNLCDNFRSAHIWYNENGKWYLRKTVF